MKLLAIDTSTRNASLAVFDGPELLKFAEIDPQLRTAATLTPALQELFNTVGWKPKDVELIAVSEGPGSFTGLRIGITTVKTLAYVTKADVLGINSLRVIANRAPETVTQISVTMDAQRRQLFVAKFQRDPKTLWQLQGELQIVDAVDWIENLSEKTTVSGPGITPLIDRLPRGVELLPEELREPNAIALGELAYADYQTGRREDLLKLLPKYYRKSAAEEKLEAKNKS
ncbi:MAG: tRNA (adenosine(37)-N6)-threonylcarbamoyltransferase complex dimerization subunit type 1 TsaB [Blastopirellula sp.]|nr:MAG: tRNA (adenosine(37)-N6)-threonylcarbamoyltransferase complex dimerization subunit type 1 TsaB [Blastopirellula sp.]